ncbi:MAG: phosphohistidine phosphatase SixA [Ghiorsea sp.]
MRIYLVQHGEAKDKAIDSERPLSDQGKEDVTRVAGFLSLFERPKPSLIVHSDKQRAVQTASMIAEAWQVLNVQESSGLAPNAMPEVWANRLQEMTEDVLFVGHLPHLSKLASLLVQGDAEKDTFVFRNGGCVCLERNENGYQVLWQINPTMFYVADD